MRNRLTSSKFCEYWQDKNMTATRAYKKRLINNYQQKFFAGIIILMVVVLISGAISIAFLYESPSIKYKFGWDKVMLRTGKVIGLAAGVLLLLQLPIAGRIKLFDRIFSLPGLYKIHRINGYIIGLLIVLHPILVTLPEDRFMIPLEARYWPEWIGVGLLLAVLGQITMGRWRTVLIKHYPRWLLMHRLMGSAIPALLIIHLLYVSETFEYDGLPRNSTIIAVVITVILWIAIRGQRLQAGRRPFEVSGIEPAGKDALSIEMMPAGQNSLQYVPGQFAFFSFASNRLSTEWHPFSLSSSPTRPGSLQITVRRSGDWTRGIDSLKKGDRVSVHGPFGRFSYLFEADNRDIIMIAGGIGITPMLSMLREIYDIGDQRRITLLWSNQTAQHEFNRDELLAFAQKLPNFTWIPVFTATRESHGEFGRLTLKSLKTLLSDCPKDAVIFLCGPPNMIKQVHHHLIALGFPAQSIREELFGL
jgi:predicted ferric reductase